MRKELHMLAQTFFLVWATVGLCCCRGCPHSHTSCQSSCTVTMHKAQGVTVGLVQTYKMVVADVRKNSAEMSGLSRVFVALSTATL